MPKVTVAKSTNPSMEPVVEAEVEEEVELEEEFVDDETIVNMEDLDPDLIIWDGGPTVRDVLQWKEEYGDVYITNVTFDKHVIWRPIFRREYAAIVKKIEKALEGGMGQTEANMYNEELIVELCTLMPKYSLKDFESELAGLPSILSQQILESSRFATIDVRKL